MQRVLTRTRWRRRAAALVATAAAAMSTVVFAPPAPAQGPAQSGCLAAQYAANAWNVSEDSGGFITAITLTNTCAETVRGWTVRLTFPQDHHLASGWAAIWTSADGTVTGTATTWNDEVRPGRSISIGFIGDFAGTYQDPLTCTINGSVCEGYEPSGNQPPVVTLSSDTSIFSFPCPITLTAEASDPDGAVDRVEFYVNDELVGTVGSAPYELEVVPGGPPWHGNQNEVVARAYDDAEPASSTDSEPVIISSLPPPPALFLVACDESVELAPGGSQTVRFVNACLSPMQVELAVAGDPGITVTPEAFTLESSQDVTITAAASSAGATATITATPTDQPCPTAQVEVSVTGEPDDNLPPEVQLTSPADGAVFGYPCGATLSAIAQDPDGAVDRVEFYVNEQLVASDDTAPYEVELPPGAFDNVAYARAFDNGDPALSTDSAPVSFTFVPPPPVPPGGTATPILNCIDSLEVQEGSSRVVTFSNICGVPGEWTITMIVDGDPAITVDPQTFVTQGGRDLTISAAPGSAGATATVSTQGGCAFASVEVTVVPAAG